jgi:hypothetical protein
MNSCGSAEASTQQSQSGNESYGRFVSVDAPASLQNFGSFPISIYSKLSTPIVAEFYIKEDGGNYASFAEKRFTLYPGENFQVVSFQNNPAPYGSYRAELRFLQDNYTTEIWSRPVTITN